MKKVTHISIALVSVAFSACAQSFEDLNFEAANPLNAGNPNYPWAVTASSALPGWTISIGGTPANQVWLNNQAAGAPEIDLFGPGYSYGNGGVIEGNYTVGLQSLAFPGTVENASIAQTAIIPLGSASLQLKTFNFGFNDGFQVSINGNVLSAVMLSTGQFAQNYTYTEYGFDVSAYAGQVGTLQITTTVPNGNGLGGFEFDDISFSQTAVTPEPSPLILYGISGLLLCARRWITSPK